MINIAIVEDQKKDAFQLLKYIKTYFEQLKIDYTYQHFHEATTFIEQYKFQYQLIFLDIDLPGINGMSAAHEIRAMDSLVSIVFTTNLSQYAINGYEVDASDFFVKPIHYESFKLKMSKVIHNIGVNTEKDLTLISKKSIHRLIISDIYFVDVHSHKLTFHTKFDVINTRGSLNDIEKQLKPHYFSRCNQGYLVNLKHIQKIEDNIVYLEGHELTISRPKKKQFMDDFTNYIGGKC